MRSLEEREGAWERARERESERDRENKGGEFGLGPTEMSGIVEARVNSGKGVGDPMAKGVGELTEDESFLRGLEDR